jgi:hypothetical protein
MAELQTVQLDDALEILILMAAEKDSRFDRATLATRSQSVPSLAAVRTSARHGPGGSAEVVRGSEQRSAPPPGGTGTLINHWIRAAP